MKNSKNYAQEVGTLHGAVQYEIAMARIPGLDLEYAIEKHIAGLDRVALREATGNAAALATVARTAYAQAKNDPSRASRNAQLRELVVWLGMVKMGWM